MSEQGAPELLPCPFCGNKAEHRNTWVWCTNVSCRAHTAGFKPAEWNTRSDICAVLVEALSFYADPRKYQGANQKADDDEETVAGYYRLDVGRDGGNKARTAIAQAREEGVK